MVPLDRIGNRGVLENGILIAPGQVVGILYAARSRYSFLKGKRLCPSRAPDHVVSAVNTTEK